MSLNNINRLVFVMEVRCVFCATEIEYLNINFMLQIINIKHQFACCASEYYDENIAKNL